MFFDFVNKLNAELAEFRTELEQGTAKQAMDSAYELVIKTELVAILTETDSVFSRWSVANQARALKMPKLLDWFYNFWLKSDWSFIPTLTEFAEFTVSERALPEPVTSVFS